MTLDIVSGNAHVKSKGKYFQLDMPIDYDQQQFITLQDNTNLLIFVNYILLYFLPFAVIFIVFMELPLHFYFNLV
jgi:hypothetical protein